MLRIALQHSLDALDRLADTGLGLLGFRPVVPRRGVHRRFGCEDLQVVIASIGIGQGRHGICILRIERGPVAIECIALPLRRDDRPFGLALIRCQFRCAIERRKRIAIGGIVHTGIDVGPVGERDAPPAHRAIGGQAGCLAEAPDRGLVIEPVGQRDALVEITARFSVEAASRDSVTPRVSDQSDRCRCSELACAEGAGEREALVESVGTAEKSAAGIATRKRRVERGKLGLGQRCRSRRGHRAGQGERCGKGNAQGGGGLHGFLLLRDP